MEVSPGNNITPKYGRISSVRVTCCLNNSYKSMMNHCKKKTRWRLLTGRVQKMLRSFLTLKIALWQSSSTSLRSHSKLLALSIFVFGIHVFSPATEQITKKLKIYNSMVYQRLKWIRFGVVILSDKNMGVFRSPKGIYSLARIKGEENTFRLN